MARRSHVPVLSWWIHLRGHIQGCAVPLLDMQQDIQYAYRHSSHLMFKKWL